MMCMCQIEREGWCPPGPVVRAIGAHAWMPFLVLSSFSNFRSPLFVRTPFSTVTLTDDARLDILWDEFLSRVAQMEQKNLALDTLRKLLADQIRASQRRNLVQSRKFREALEEAMLRSRG